MSLVPRLCSFVVHQSRYCIIGLLVGFALADLQPFRSPLNAVSLVTAYASVSLLGVTMLFGPLHVLNGGRPILSSSSRRHLGVWSGVFAILHVAAGINVHMGGRYLDYFFAPAIDSSMRPVRMDPFGVANYIGLAATLLVILLMIISNNRWVRSLGPTRWKRLQRGAYWLIVLVFSHGFLYQEIETRGAVPIIALVLILSLIVGYQLAGRAQWILREPRRSPKR